MWRTARALDVLLEQLNARYPNRSKASDGAIGDEAHRNTVSDHNPDSAGVVRARDFTHDPEEGLDAGALADALLASRDPRIKYIISNGRIGASYHVPNRAAWTWGVYTGANAHRSHVHVSVLAGPAGDDPAKWAAVDPTMPPRPRPRPASRATTRTPAPKGLTVRLIDLRDTSPYVTGPGVKPLQRLLGVPADGKGGPGTATALERAQRRAGLTPDRVFGPATAEALLAGK